MRNTILIRPIALKDSNVHFYYPFFALENNIPSYAAAILIIVDSLKLNMQGHNWSIEEGKA